MAVQVLKDYCLGDMIVRYVTDEEKKQVGLVLPGRRHQVWRK